MIAKHTPAPWKTRKGFGHGEIDIFHPRRDVKKPFVPTELAIVQVNDDTKESIAESRANARLIAAAPELLAACLLAEEEIYIGAARDALKSALTKALGPDWQNAKSAGTDASAPRS